MTDSLPPDLMALSSLDARDGLRRIGGDPDAYRRQLRRFRARYPGVVDELRQLTADQDLAQAAACCHALKGVAGNLGALKLYRQAVELDARLKRRQLPDAAALDLLDARLAEVLRDIDRLPPEPNPVVVAALDPSAVQERLLDLERLLDRDFGAAESLLSELRAGIADAPLASRLAAIAAAVDICDIDRALRLLTELRELPEPSTGSILPS